MRRLLYGHLVSRALCVVAALRLPDVMGDGTWTVKQLAERVDARPAALWQLMRALSAFEVFTHHPDDRFSLTPLGATLRQDATASALPTALLVGNEIGQAWNELLSTIRTGESAFQEVYGSGFWPYLTLKPELEAVFDQSQVEGLQLELDSILQTIDFAGHRVIVDVGGGDGALLAEVLAAYPACRGVLLELPRLLPKANARLARTGVAGRCEAVGGNFFDAVPPGGDMYLLRQILHDWDDEHCTTLLRACRRAMSADATLVVVDLLPEQRIGTGPVAEMTGVMDLYMLSIFDGRERTLPELDALLSGCGFAVTDVARLAGGMAAITASPA